MILERRHPVVVDSKKPESSWREWAYEQAKAHDIAPHRAVRLTFRPMVARPDRAFGPAAMWRTIDYVLDGLIAAGVLRSRQDVAVVEVHAAVVGQCEGLTVELG